MAKRIVSLVLALTMLAILVSGCKAGGEKTDDGTVRISYYSTQADVDDLTIELLDKFMAENPDIRVEYYPCGDDQLAAWLTLYNANTAPTVSMLDVGQILQYSDYLYDFRSEDNSEFLSHILSGTEFCEKDGKLFGIPTSYQGFGLMVNLRVLAEVYGADYDLASVNTAAKLEEFFAGFEKAGVAPTIVFSADWALGAHYLGCQLFSEWQGDKATQRAMLQGLKDGTFSLIDNEAFNNIMDMFDVLMKYNLNKDDPLADSQENDCYNFATGKAATFFQGDWNWLYLGKIDASERDEMAFMPLPLTNDASDSRNGKILGSCPKGYAIDVSQNTPEQIEAGKRLVEWLTLSQDNEAFMVNVIGSTLPFDNVTVTSENPLAASTKDYLDRGQMLDISTYICEGPSDFWYIVGPLMQAYLAGQSTRAQLAQGIEEYFANL